MNNTYNNIPTEVLERQELEKVYAQEFERDRKELLEYATAEGVGIVHIFDKNNPKGGLTVAFRKIMPERVSHNMVQVAVATCSLMDNFSRKIGTAMALNKFECGETIDLPLSSGWKDEDLAGIVKRKFTALYFTE